MVNKKVKRHHTEPAPTPVIPPEPTTIETSNDVTEPTTPPVTEPTPEVTEPVSAPVVDKVKLQLVGPWFATSFSTFAADGAKLTIDRNGVKVDAPAVDAIVKKAAASGITLKIGK